MKCTKCKKKMAMSEFSICRECMAELLKTAQNDADETIKELKKGRTIKCTCCPIHHTPFRKHHI